MTDEQINIAIAESLGWKLLANNRWTRPCGIYADLPNYTADLNAMQEAEKVLLSSTPHLRRTYRNILIDCCENTSDSFERYWMATAKQRAEAFLRTLNLWEQ